MNKPRVYSVSDLNPPHMAEKMAADYEIVRDPADAADIEVAQTSGGRGFSAAEMAAMPALRQISVFGVGVDAIDLAEARRRNIIVTNTPDVLSLAVAEMSLGLVLAAGRRIAEGDRFVRAGEWSKGNLPLGMSVLERRAGILGYGRIGRKLADLLRGMGMEILYTARSSKPDSPDEYRPDPVALARDCDLLFVTAAGGEGTVGLVGAEALDALGPQGIIVNVARGPVVDADALAEALQSGRIAGAGLDVFDDEPNVPEALLKAPNCVLAPHIGSATTEARVAMAQLTLDNIAAYFAGLPLPTPFPNE